MLATRATSPRLRWKRYRKALSANLQGRPTNRPLPRTHLLAPSALIISTPESPKKSWKDGTWASTLFTKAYTRLWTKDSLERPSFNRRLIINVAEFTAANSPPTTTMVRSRPTEIWLGDGRAARIGVHHSSSSPQTSTPLSKSTGFFSTMISALPLRLVLLTVGTTGKRLPICFMEVDFEEDSSTPRACPITQP